MSNYAPKKLADETQCARMIGINTRTLRKYVSQGKVPAIRLSQRILRFDLDAVLAALSSK